MQTLFLTISMVALAFIYQDDNMIKVIIPAFLSLIIELIRNKKNRQDKIKIDLKFEKGVRDEDPSQS